MIYRELEGEFEEWHTLPYSLTKICIVKFPGPEPYTETHASVTEFVAQSMESIELGAKVRITVEELK